MRIDVLTSLYPSPPRPYEGIFAERRWRGMAERGHEVRVFHPQPRTPWPFVSGSWSEIHRMPGRERRGPIEVRRPRYVHVPRRPRGNAERFAAAGLAAMLGPGAASEPPAAEARRPDVVVADYAWPASAAAPALAARGIPCVVSGRGSDVLQVAGEAGLAEPLAANLRAAGYWCAVSRDLLARMDELGGGRGTLVPNGVDLERFRPADRGAARARLGLEPEGALVLVVGHLIERKDPLLALAAFAAGAPADARLVFLGRGPLERELSAAIGERGLAARVRLAGEAPPERLADWYAAADALLLTSRREGRPNVVLESLASGRPVVATAAGGTGELLEPWPDRLVAERDPARIGAALARVLAAPPEPETLRAAVKELSWERSAERLEALLGQAVGEPLPR